MDYEKLVSDLVSYLKSFRIQDIGQINEKSENDFVTAVDFYLQQEISKILKCYSSIPVFGEESVKSKFIEVDEFWVVDPLDGTSNFIKDIPLTASAVALVKGGVAQFGFVYEFGIGKAYWAKLGGGSYINSNLMQPKLNETGPKLVGCSTGFLRELNRSAYPYLRKGTFKNCNFRVLGSQALQLCYVASGKFIANFSVEAKIWDDLAASLIVSEAGYFYNSIALHENTVHSCFMHNTNMRSVANVDILQFKEDMKLMESLNKWQ